MVNEKGLRAAALMLAVILSGLLCAQSSFIYEIDHPFMGANPLQFMDLSRIGPDLYRVSGYAYRPDSARFFRVILHADGSLSDGLSCPLDTNATIYPAVIANTADGGQLFTHLWVADATDRQVFLNTDADGNVEWERYYPDNYGLFLNDAEQGMVQKDGGYFVLGHSQDVPVNTGWPSTLLQLDANGAAVQTLSIGEGGFWSHSGRALLRTRSNGLVTAALQAPYWAPSYHRNIAVQRWSSGLSIEWSKSFSYYVGNTIALTSLIELQDGGLMISGGVAASGGPNESILFKVDSTGQLAWGRKWTAPGPVVIDVVEEPDGSFTMVGVVAAQSAFVVARLDSTGALLNAWIADQLDTPVRPYELLRDSASGEHLIRGRRWNASNTMVVIRLDSALGLDCGTSPYAWQDTLVPPLAQDFPVSVVTGMVSSFDTAAVAQPASFASMDLCLTTGVSALSPSIPGIEVWPVPTSGRLFVHASEASVPWTITITDPQGRQVLVRRMEHGGGGPLELDLSGRNAGAYFLAATSDDRCQQVVIIKE